MTKSFDIIGDVHGRVTELRLLLSKMGYQKKSDSWRHPDKSRSAIFVGDLINGGNDQAETLRLVQEMVDAGAAQIVLGNHELGAMRWFAPNPYKKNSFCLEHTSYRTARYAQFLHQVQTQAKMMDEVLEWFYSIPLWLDLPEIRIIHACWHEPSMKIIQPCLTSNNSLRPEVMSDIFVKDAHWLNAIEILTSGMETELPGGISFTDSNGLPRNVLRLAWWQGAGTYKERVLVAPGDDVHFNEEPIPENKIVHYDNQKPLFIGHFWMRGRPQILTPKIACVDYSAESDTSLSAYSWNGERNLQTENFVVLN